MALDFHIAESEHALKSIRDEGWRYGLSSDDHYRVILRYKGYLNNTNQAKKIVDYLSDAVFSGKEIVVFMDELREFKKELRDEWNKEVVDRLIGVCTEALESNFKVFTFCD